MDFQNYESEVSTNAQFLWKHAIRFQYSTEHILEKKSYLDIYKIRNHRLPEKDTGSTTSHKGHENKRVNSLD